MVPVTARFATMLLESGIAPKIVQDILGHANITTTLNIYSHVLPELFDGIADTLDKVYSDTLLGTYKPQIIDKNLK